MRSTGLSLALLMVAAMPVSAAEVSFSGSTNGCFGVACAPGDTSTTSGLTYRDATFAGATASGFLGIGNVAATPPAANVDNLGSMALTGGSATYTGQPFTLQVIFEAPPRITGGATQTYVASLLGVVTGNDLGGVLIDFNNNPVVYSFSNPESFGTFSFLINDAAVTPGRTVALTGFIQAAQQTVVPEPATLMLLGTGLAGVAISARRRLMRRT